MQSAPQPDAGVKYEYWPSSGWIPKTVMQNTLQTDSPELMTAQQVKAMSIGDHQHLWRVSRPHITSCQKALLLILCLKHGVFSKVFHHC